MFDFFKSLFKPPAASGETAKERLRLVLLSDHLSLAPDVVDSLKRDLMEVISRYVEIDSANADVTFEHREREIAMLANIPITGVRERKAPVAPSAPPIVAPAVAPEPVAVAVAEPEPIAEPEAPQPELDLSVAAVEAPDVKPKAKKTPPATAAQAPVRASNGAAPRRRRRKKYAAAAAATANRNGQSAQQASAKA